jgi:hypothetical protein
MRQRRAADPLLPDKLRERITENFSVARLVERTEDFLRGLLDHPEIPVA